MQEWKENFGFPITRHLEDQPIKKIKNNNIINLDTSLKIESEQNEKNINIIVDNVENLILKYNKVLLIVSGKKRTFETAELVKSKLKDEDKDKVDIRILSDFSEINQGVSIFPTNYKNGDKIKHLSEAWKELWNETFKGIDFKNIQNTDIDKINFKNPYYKMGEKTENNKFEMYIKTGESYIDLNLRVYKGLLKLLKYLYMGFELDDNDKTGICLITHSAVVSIIKSLNKIGNDYIVNNIPFENLLLDSWKMYINELKIRKPGSTNFGQLEYLDLSFLDNKDKINILIKNLKNIILMINQKYYENKNIPD